MDRDDSFCCGDMRYHATFRCDVHADAFECPDAVVYYGAGKYGLIIHDGGRSFIEINFCPWCGKRLTDKTENKGE